jgi:hypothetical protein
MITMIQTLARLGFVVIAITVCQPAAPSGAQNFTFAFVAANGSGSTCTAAQPCASFFDAFGVIHEGAPNRIICLSPINTTTGNETLGPGQSNTTLEIDCPAGTSIFGLSWGGTISNSTGKFRNLTFTNLGFLPAIQFQSSGTLIFENCIFESSGSASLDIEPNGPLQLVIRNSRISNNASGILLKPAAGGSIKATLDHVVITGNSGGGIKSDSTNGVVNLDVTASEISNNSGNGINAVAGAISQNIISIKNSVIARNGAAGVQVNGANAGVLLSTTLLDQNAAGATSVVSGGNMFTYGNNDVVGSVGSGFTATAPLH